MTGNGSQHCGSRECMAALQGLGAGLPLHRGPSLPARPAKGASKQAKAAPASRGAVQAQQSTPAGNKQGSSAHSAGQPAPEHSGRFASLNEKAALSPRPQLGKQTSSGPAQANTCLSAQHLSFLTQQTKLHDIEKPSAWLRLWMKET